MIVRSGLALSLPVMFPSGHPDGDINWHLYGVTGVEIASGTAVVPLDAVSVVLTVSAINNTLANGVLFGSRDFEWSYTVGGAVVNGAQRYSIEARPPYGSSNDGVRSKLGVEQKDLPDSDISLIGAFVAFRDLVGEDLLVGLTDDATLLAVRNAIEAQAAFALISTMAVRVAVSEDSGTNAYKRQAVDWDGVASSLSRIINAGITAVDPLYDPTPTGALFILATPATDPITGSAYV